MSESDRRAEDSFVRIEVRASGERAERALAEVWQAGASGVEELTRELIVVYAPRAKAEAVRAAAAIGLGDVGAVGRAVAIDDRRWSEEWKRHLRAITISPRLRIRPPFIAATGRAGQIEVVVEPGQAFGIGGHESTRLALEWVDVVASADARAGSVSRWLDVGTGTGVLAIAALRLGAASALGIDLDPLATSAALECGRRNGVAARFEVRCAAIDSLPARGFERVVANLLRSELLPIAHEVAARVAAGGVLIVSGLLEADESAVLAAFAPFGLVGAGRRSCRDADGEVWLGLRLDRPDTRDL